MMEEWWKIASQAENLYKIFVQPCQICPHHLLGLADEDSNSILVANNIYIFIHISCVIKENGNKSHYDDSDNSIRIIPLNRPLFRQTITITVSDVPKDKSVDKIKWSVPYLRRHRWALWTVNTVMAEGEAPIKVTSSAVQYSDFLTNRFPLPFPLLFTRN